MPAAVNATRKCRLCRSSVQGLLLGAAAMGWVAGCARPGVTPTPSASAAPPPAVPAPAVSKDGVVPSGAEAADSEVRQAALAHYQEGLDAFARGDAQAATESFRRTLARDPTAVQAYVALGNVQQRTGNVSGALASYSAALNRKAGYGPAALAKVELLLAVQRQSEAERSARELLAQFPQSAHILTALAEVRSLRGDSAGCQQLAQRALKRDPDFRPAMVTIARDHYRSRRLDLALYTLTAILDGFGAENPPRDRDNPQARFLRALIYKEQLKRQLAMDELTRVIESRPDWVQARLQLSAFMLEAGNAQQARPLLEGALKFEPSNLMVHINLGDAYRLLGKPQDALDHLQWARRKDPELAAVYYNLGLVYLFSPKVPNMTEAEAVDAAIESFERFRGLQPRTGRSEGGDAEQLLARARNRKAILEALAEELNAEDSEEEEWD